MRTNNIFLCISFVILWSSGWIGSKFGVDLIGPFTFLSWRYLLVVVILGLSLLALRQWQHLRRAEWQRHMSVGVLSHGVYLGGSLCAMDAGVSAGMVALITSMQPMITSVIASGMGLERTNRNQWLGLILGITAVITIIYNQLSIGGSAVAYLMLFGSVLGLSVATLIDRRHSLTQQVKATPTPLLQTLFIHSLAALAFFSVFGWSLEGMQTRWSVPLVNTLLYMAVVVSIGSYGLLFLLLRRVTAVQVSSLAYLTQGTTMLMAWMILGETLSTNQWIGLLLASIAVLMVCGGHFTANPSDARYVAARRVQP